MTITTEPQLIWEKEIGKFRLVEFEKRPNLIPCNVHYFDGEQDLNFHFGSWGMDRELINEQHCLTLCQYMLDFNCDVSIGSFAGNLAYALSDMEEEVE